jgi:acetylglutamate kinase
LKGVIAKGMIPKMDNSFNAIGSGVKSVIICRADHLLTNISSTEGKIGTELHL